MKKPVYLDYAATTPCDPGVIEFMLPFFGERFGNSASRYHVFGWEAEEAVEEARKAVARLIGAKPGEIGFTSGATESTNLALRGFLSANRKAGKHIVTLPTEHKCVLEALHQLEGDGFSVTTVGVGPNGLPDLGELEQAIRSDTVLLCAMYANNETGVVLPVHEIAVIARRHGVAFFCDGTQAVGKITVDVKTTGMDLMAFTAHKIYGPKGVGAIYIRGGIHMGLVRPLITGGSHEGGLRGGTLNVAGIAGFGEAARICFRQLDAEYKQIRKFQAIMENVLLQIPGVHLNGDPNKRLPHITNLSIKGIDSEKLLLHLSSRLALGSGSACSSITRDPSHVLKAMGVTGDLLHNSIRISRGRFTSEEEIHYATDEIIIAISTLRS